MFKVGNKINYGFYTNIKIIGEDENHFILEDKHKNIKKIYKTLINRHSKLIKE